ncbi:MAG TPA: hypothetical protein ENH28_00350 [Euryarchaeota archaeon]|nr:hypothetical protein [Euryarchaeota archaeon]
MAKLVHHAEEVLLQLFPETMVFLQQSITRGASIPADLNTTQTLLGVGVVAVIGHLSTAVLAEWWQLPF